MAKGSKTDTWTMEKLGRLKELTAELQSAATLTSDSRAEYLGLAERMSQTISVLEDTLSLCRELYELRFMPPQTHRQHEGKTLPTVDAVEWLNDINQALELLRGEDWSVLLSAEGRQLVRGVDEYLHAWVTYFDGSYQPEIDHAQTTWPQGSNAHDRKENWGGVGSLVPKVCSSGCDWEQLELLIQSLRSLLPDDLEGVVARLRAGELLSDELMPPQLPSKSDKRDTASDNKVPPPVSSPSGVPEKLTPALEKAYLSHEYAERKCKQPLTAKQAHEYLEFYGMPDESDAETKEFAILHGYRLPKFETWKKYVSQARNVLGQNRYEKQAKGYDGRSAVRPDELDSPPAE